MRNIFDQYDQPENKLTHALYCTLVQDRSLIRPFLTWLGIDDIPPLKDIKIVEQQIPGVKARDFDDEESGVPDLCFYIDTDLSEDGWAILFEMKVQATLSGQQLQRHATTAKRAGFNSPKLVAVTVDVPKASVPLGTVLRQWRDLYAWFDRQESTWARILVDYMETFETKAIAKEYEVRGTITTFNGLRFDSDRPYAYREAKRLIRLLGDELQSRDDLHRELGVDPQGQRRPAITDGAGVWDFLPLREARGKDFIRFPHLTMSIRDTYAIAAITVPNGVSGGFRTRLRANQFDGFLKLIRDIEGRLRPVIGRSNASKSIMYATQRHYRTQKSSPSVDGRIELDLRTCLATGSSIVKYQPEWAEALYHLLVNKRSNIQFGIEMQFSYSCETVKSPAALDLFADSWKAMKPLLDFVLCD